MTSIAARKAALKSRISNWVFSVVAMIIAPLFPLFVEAMKHSWEIKRENYLLTVAVLAVGFGFSSLGNAYRAAYFMLFLLAIGADMGPDTAAHADSALIPGAQVLSKPIASQWGVWDTCSEAWSWALVHPALDLVIIVTVLHAIERFNWHVVLDRRFPDWLKDAP